MKTSLIDAQNVAAQNKNMLLSGSDGGNCVPALHEGWHFWVGRGKMSPHVRTAVCFLCPNAHRQGTEVCGKCFSTAFPGEMGIFLLAQGKLNRYLLSYSFVVSLKILKCLVLFGAHTLHWPRPHLPVSHVGVTLPSSAPPRIATLDSALGAASACGSAPSGPASLAHGRWPCPLFSRWHRHVRTLESSMESLMALRGHVCELGPEVILELRGKIGHCALETLTSLRVDMCRKALIHLEGFFLLLWYISFFNVNLRIAWIIIKIIIIMDTLKETFLLIVMFYLI